MVKVGMVGDSQIGKTSLMVKYVEGKFQVRLTPIPQIRSPHHTVGSLSVVSVCCTIVLSWHIVIVTGGLH
jgi:GTPase SAR1 family protein